MLDLTLIYKDMKRSLTPAEDYALRMINAIDGFLDNPDDTDWSDEILMFILERPKTLRSALAAYLYKSQSARVTRGTCNHIISC